MAHQEHQRQAEELRHREQTKNQLLREQDDALQALCAHLIETQPDLLTEAITTLRAHKEPVVMFCYEATRSALENYHAHPAVAGAVNSWLAARFPEPFERVTKSFAERLTTLEVRCHTLAKPLDIAAG